MKLKSVIFDMDGVLVDSNALHFEAFTKIGEIIGEPFTEEMLHRTIGMHNNQIFPLWLGPHLTEARVQELALMKEGIYRNLAATRLKEIPGATEYVKTLRKAGYSLAVGSSGPRLNVELAIKTLQLGSYFSAIVCGDDVRHGKPSPDIFLTAAQRLGSLPPDCLVIEDAPQGIQAAISAGMKVVALTTSQPREKLIGADWVVNSFQEIHNLNI